MSVTNTIKKTTVPSLIKKKEKGEKITALTAYDFLMAEILDESGVDIVLVGDSLGMVVAGFQNTVTVTMDMMLHHIKAVRNGVKNSLLVGDMPFLSYQVDLKEAVQNAGRFIQEGGAEAVKLEGGKPVTEIISRLTDIGIPVMSHLGLTPQSIHKFGNYRLVGKAEKVAEQLMEDARLVEQAGAFSLVLEMVPTELAQKISAELKIPTIGIGSGKYCDGQILVSHDMLGYYTRFKPKFVRHYAHINQEMRKAFTQYIDDVKSGNYPSENESY